MNIEGSFMNISYQSSAERLLQRWLKSFIRLPFFLHRSLNKLIENCGTINPSSRRQRGAPRYRVDVNPHIVQQATKSDRRQSEKCRVPAKIPYLQTSLKTSEWWGDDARTEDVGWNKRTCAQDALSMLQVVLRASNTDNLIRVMIPIMRNVEYEKNQ